MRLAKETALALELDDGVAGGGSVVVVGVSSPLAVGLALPLPLLEREEDDEDARRWLLASVAAGVDGADADDELRLAFRQPPPTGTLRRTPPLVQYRRQLLQKWRGCDKL